MNKKDLENRLITAEKNIADIKECLEKIADSTVHLLQQSISEAINEEPVNKKLVAKILPRMNNKDLNSLNDNDNVLSSTFYKTLLLVDTIADELNIGEVITEDNTKDYDIIISRWMGEAIESVDKSKPIYEFHYCSLNAGWFFERFTHNDISFETSYYVAPNKKDVRPAEEIKAVTGLTEKFYSPQVKSPVTDKDL